MKMLLVVMVIWILPYAPLVCAPILALTIPKTWGGKALALLPASVFVFIDWLMVEQWKRASGSDWGDFLTLPFLHFWLLVIFAVAIAFRKTSKGKASLTLLLVALVLFFAILGLSEWGRKAELSAVEEKYEQKLQEVNEALRSGKPYTIKP